MFAALGREITILLVLSKCGSSGLDFRHLSAVPLHPVLFLSVFKEDRGTGVSSVLFTALGVFLTLALALSPPWVPVSQLPEKLTKEAQLCCGVNPCEVLSTKRILPQPACVWPVGKEISNSLS